MAAANALAEIVGADLSPEYVLPNTLESRV